MIVSTFGNVSTQTGREQRIFCRAAQLQRRHRGHSLSAACSAWRRIFIAFGCKLPSVSTTAPQSSANAGPGVCAKRSLPARTLSASPSRQCSAVTSQYASPAEQKKCARLHQLENMLCTLTVLCATGIGHLALELCTNCPSFTRMLSLYISVDLRETWRH